MPPTIRVRLGHTWQIRSWVRECMDRKFSVLRVHVTYYLDSIAYEPSPPRSVQGNSKLSKSNSSFKDFPGLSAPSG